MREELTVLEALLQAMDRRGEVFEAIEDSENVDEAIQRVSELFGVGALESRAVLDLQARRLTRDQRRKSAFRADELRSLLLKGR